MKEKEVLFVIFQSPNRANGGVASISQIVQNLKIYSPTIITQIHNAKVSEWKSRNLNVQVWKIARNKPVAFIIFNLRAFFFSLLNKRIKCVHCNDINAMIYFGIGARMAGKRVLFNIRDVKSQGDYGIKWKIAVNVAQKIIVLSNEMKELIVSRIKLNPKKVISIYSIVDFNTFTPKKEAQKEEFKVGCVAAVFSKKQQLKFLKEAGPFLQALPENIKFYFVGDFDPNTNDYAKQCQNELERQQLKDRVIFVGYKQNMPEVYQSLDVNLVISEREGLARGMIESISVGTPVISFDVPSAREILEVHNCGVVLEQGDYLTLINKIKYYYDNQYLLKELSINAIKMSRELFNLDQVIDSYEATYGK